MNYEDRQNAYIHKIFVDAGQVWVNPMAGVDLTFCCFWF